MNFPKLVLQEGITLKRIKFLDKLRDRFYRELDIPPEIKDGFMAEMYGLCELRIKGCYGIEEFSPEKIVLNIGQIFTVIEGRGLECPGFSGGYIAVTGEIENILFREEYERC